MRIGIDMRMAGTGEGIGRYIEELVRALSKIDQENEYFLLLRPNFQFQISPPSGDLPQGDNFKQTAVNANYYSWAEQTKFIWELKRLKLDLVHFASFNAPILYPGKFVVTIHDIIHHLYPGKKKSRFFHRLAYKATITSTVRRAKRIIAVSEATKKDLLKTFCISPDKVEVISEGIEEQFSKSITEEKISKVLAKYEITKPYILFVGVWRQYKNLPRLAQAFDILQEKTNGAYQLVLAGKIDPYYPEIKSQIMDSKYSQDIRSLGFVPDWDLHKIYRGARAFVLPSLIEGFGLIGIEAQASGVPVVCSNIEVLKEVLGPGAIYFDPLDINDMASKVHEVLQNAQLAGKIKDLGVKNAEKFNWDTAARKTLDIYRSIKQ
ncbi:glycosyltransferase family 1 protein [bacterium]|nr:MAG: glycosyltransferase family 1 protein [bacterium]